MKRYTVYLDHFNDSREYAFESDNLASILRYIANNIDGVKCPDKEDNTTDNLYCYHLYDKCKEEDDGEGNMIPSEVFHTDYFYIE